MSEIWRAIPGWVGFYEVSSKGRVRSVDRLVRVTATQVRRYPGKERKLVANTSGYPMVGLKRPGFSRREAVHRLVLFAFSGPCPPDMEACHNNGIRDDNRIENLRWDTHSENIRDIIRHGRHNHAKKTHCVYGHPFDESNTNLYRGKRACRTCTARRSAAKNAKRAAARRASVAA